MKKLVILVLVLAVAAVFWSKKSEKSQEKNPEVNSDTEETDSVDTESDEEFCSMARKDNTRRAWEIYLERFPKGKCAKEGIIVRDKYKKIGNLEWSNAFDSEIHWGDAAYIYCKNLEEDGHTDWRLPNIDELRTLVQNHSGTVVGGKCKISEEHNKLNEEDWTEDCRGREDNNLSKLGDHASLLSSSRYVVSEEQGQGAWVVNFYNGGVENGSESGWVEYRSVRCVRQDEVDACETAKKYNKPDYWFFYFDNFSDSECDAKAKSIWEKEDKKACASAKKANTRAAWEKYLKKFPKGKCAEEGNAVRNKFEKVDGFEWSDISDGVLDFDETGGYCANLREGGHDDWRIPTIDELRLLVQNHPGTVSDGKCQIAEASEEYQEYSRFGLFYDENGNCDGIKGGNFSKFGDKESLWSSTLSDDWQTIEYWSLDFNDGGISSSDAMRGARLYARCIRQDDIDACEEARKEDTYESWEYYLSLFPEGKCLEEAKAAFEDDPVCKRARKQNTRASWEFYLKKFPDGKCAKEGNAVRNKYKRVRNLEWSDIVDSWSVSCEALEEDGHNDWREPNIDELRILVKDHPGTVAGGTCKIYAKDSLEFDDESDEIDYLINEAENDDRFDFKNCDGIKGENFSKLGDTGWLDSSSISGVAYRYGVTAELYFSIHFDDGRLSPNGRFGRKRCVRQDEPDACKTAQKYNKPYYWKHYFENFPNGKCATEAKKKIGAKKEPEKAADKKGGKQPATNPADKKAMAGKKWSLRSSKAMNWKQANKYCENLKEGGSSDWRLPTISELRTLITECESTEAGGTCGVTDQCLSVGECKNKACSGCGRKAQHNRFGDKGFFWSSSISPDNDNAWYIDFTYGSIHSHSNSEKFVRCVSHETASDAGTKVSTEKDDSIAFSKKTFPYKDLQTGYIWSGVSKKVMNWDSAKQYCAGLKEGNENDWRLPNIDELRTLVQKCPQTETGGTCAVTENCLSQSSCQNTACMGCESKNGHNKLGDKGFFWSSSISPDNNNAWYIDFTYASVHNHSKSEKHVRCVRSEITSENDSEIRVIEDDSCDSVSRTFPCKDSETGYMWSDISERVMNWETAKKYCKRLKEGTGNEWRLPNIDELRTLLKSNNAATDGTCKVSAKNKCLASSCWSMETCFEDACRVSEEKCFFKDGRYSKLEDGRNNNVWLWSSSVKSDKSDKNKSNKKGNAWYIDFNKGGVHDYRKDSKFYVRCVKTDISEK